MSTGQECGNCLCSSVFVRQVVVGLVTDSGCAHFFEVYFFSFFYRQG